jgi:hypothetical protein
MPELEFLRELNQPVAGVGPALILQRGSNKLAAPPFAVSRKLGTPDADR